MKYAIFKIFDKFTEEVNYYTNNGSLWLIFTDEKKWVIILQSDGTLWYNYSFFKDCFKYFSLDVIKNQHFITEWAEDTIQNRVKHTADEDIDFAFLVEDTIQNGVKHTPVASYGRHSSVEDTIQNGIKI